MADHTPINTLEFLEDLERSGVDSVQARTMVRAWAKAIDTYRARLPFLRRASHHDYRSPAINTLEYSEDLEQAGIKTDQARAMAKALNKALLAHLAQERNQGRPGAPSSAP